MTKSKPVKRLSELYGILAPNKPMPPLDREAEREAVAQAAGRYDAEKTAKIMKRLKRWRRAS